MARPRATQPATSVNRLYDCANLAQVFLAMGYDRLTTTSRMRCWRPRSMCGCVTGSAMRPSAIAETVIAASCCSAPQRASRGRRRGRTRRPTMASRYSGDGNQFFAYGIHPSGAELQWIDGPVETPRELLPALTNEQCQEIIDHAANLIEPTARRSARSMSRCQDRMPLGMTGASATSRRHSRSSRMSARIGSSGSASPQQCSTPAMVRRKALTPSLTGHAKRDHVTTAQTSYGAACIAALPTRSRQVL